MAKKYGEEFESADSIEAVDLSKSTEASTPTTMKDFVENTPEVARGNCGECRGGVHYTGALCECVDGRKIVTK
jgi:hypothetical protein